MAGHPLITAQLDALAARLPAPAAAELADGLWETYERRLDECGDPDRAAYAAVTDFGDADTITAAFLRHAPQRRVALLLLATGPIMAVLWGTALLTAHALAWPVPPAGKLLYGGALMATVALLLMTIRERRSYRRGRAMTVGALAALIALDVLMSLTAVTVGPVPAWPTALAVTASMLRILLALRALPSVLTG
ncbi:hypothetical protein [Planobispora takensis]|uniref:Uncharacterized protein n=1 Tax=Planobispora takensis TaxID=1367882 RepID=A0A8J3SV30_9ACTN|nr:hypothetical protein [Planobispora takensis]GIH99576.1 hypothetical protein Pta02_15850 [Planobispora takensis]